MFAPGSCQYDGATRKDNAAHASKEPLSCHGP